MSSFVCLLIFISGFMAWGLIIRYSGRRRSIILKCPGSWSLAPEDPKKYVTLSELHHVPSDSCDMMCWIYPENDWICPRYYWIGRKLDWIGVYGFIYPVLPVMQWLKKRQFCLMGGFSLFAELHWEGSAIVGIHLCSFWNISTQVWYILWNIPTQVWYILPNLGVVTNVNIYAYRGHWWATE